MQLHEVSNFQILSVPTNYLLHKDPFEQEGHLPHTFRLRKVYLRYRGGRQQGRVELSCVICPKSGKYKQLHLHPNQTRQHLQKLTLQKPLYRW